MPDPCTVVLITGAAPYLGGRTTWLPLRHAAPDIDFNEIDALDFVEPSFRNLSDAAETAILRKLRNANAIVAHAGAARLVLEIVAREYPDMPVLLLSPILITRDTLALQVLRSVFGRPPGSWLLTVYARSKHRRLKRDRPYVEQSLKLFVGQSALNAALVEEAQARIRDPRSDRAVEMTPEFFLYSTMPVSAQSIRAVANRIVLIGCGMLDRKTAKRMAVTVVPGVNAAAMLDAPNEVARALRSLLARPSSQAKSEWRSA